MSYKDQTLSANTLAREASVGSIVDDFFNNLKDEQCFDDDSRVEWILGALAGGEYFGPQDVEFGDDGEDDMLVFACMENLREVPLR